MNKKPKRAITLEKIIGGRTCNKKFYNNLKFNFFNAFSHLKYVLY